MKKQTDQSNSLYWVMFWYGAQLIGQFSFFAYPQWDNQPEVT